MNETLNTAVAQERLQEVETLVSKLADAEGLLEAGYAKLAFMLKDVSEHRYWQGKYKSFGEFLNSIQERYHLGKSQLYSYLSTARDLAGQLDEDQLNFMGISKAMVLRDATNASGKVSEEVISAALNPNVTTKDLKKLLYDAGSLQEPEEGIWTDLEFSTYLTPEEHKTILDAFNAARHTDPPINEKTKDSVQRKEILLRICQEFLAAYADDVVEGGRNL